MDHTQVLVKTAKGKEEIRSKAFNLPPRLRRVLVLVDGHSTAGATLDRLAALEDDVESQLDTLLADGFLAAEGSPPNPVDYSFDEWQAVAGEPWPRARDHRERAQAELNPIFNLDKAKGFARFVILGYLGPVGAHRVERIESARSVQELRAELDDLRDILPRLLHRRQAQQLWDQLKPLTESPGLAESSPLDPIDTLRRPARRGRARARGTAAWGEARKTPVDAADTALANTILEYAEPLLRGSADMDAAKRAIQIAITCWNAATLPDKKGLETVAPALRQIAGGDTRLERELFEILGAMHARKQTRFGAVDRFVVDFSLSEGPNGLHLSVVSRPLLATGPMTDA